MFDTWTALDSTSIQALQYDETTKVLQIRFARGSEYQYEGVPADVVTGLAHASSPGRYFRANIAGAYGDEGV